MHTASYEFKAKERESASRPQTPPARSSLGTRPSKNRKGGSGTSAVVEVYTAEC